MRARTALSEFFSRCSIFYLRVHKNFHLCLWNSQNDERPGTLRSKYICHCSFLNIQDRLSNSQFKNSEVLITESQGRFIAKNVSFLVDFCYLLVKECFNRTLSTFGQTFNRSSWIFLYAIGEMKINAGSARQMAKSKLS